MTWQDPEAHQEALKYDNPIPSRTLILKVFDELGKAQTHENLARHFDIDDEARFEALGHRLKAMLRDGQLKEVSSSPTKLAPIDIADLIVAEVEAHPKGFGFAVVKDAPDLFLSAGEMRKVFNGDTVKVVPSHTDRRGRTYGKILSVTARNQTHFIGVLEKDDDGYICQLGTPNSHQPIAIEPEDVKQFGANVGDALHVEIVHWPTQYEIGAGDITKVMNDATERDVIVQTTVLDFDIPHEFPKAVLKEAQSFGEPNYADFDPQKRHDLRHLPLVTIDGEDARDFDDAVYAEKRRGGGYRLVVAIADVSHYVTIGSSLDNEAWQRGTSVYFPQAVMPMLPEALSNGLCSLNPHVDRLCMVCDLTMSKVGKVTGYEFYPAIMHSQARLTYTQVAAYLDEENGAKPADGILKNKAVQKSLHTLYALFKVMQAVRKARHAMEFETTETYMTFNDDGSIADIKPRTRNDAHRLIEECMLLANVAAAEFAQKQDLAVLYRNHATPEGEKAQRLKDYLAGFGLPFPAQNPTQADYDRIIEATRERPDVAHIHSMLLRSMMQAYYGPDNIGHFGLAYDNYTHFTSPIRRYPDLMLHRAIKAKVLGKSKPIYQIDEARSLASAGEHLSNTERRAENASRSVESWLKCHYMKQHVGDVFTGVVSTVAEFGLFITLTELYVDGLVHISELGNDFFEYDAKNQVLLGRDHGQLFGLGDVVSVKVAGVNLEERKIDFALVDILSSQGSGSRRKRQTNKSAKRRTSSKSGSTKTDGKKPKAKSAKRSKNKQKSGKPRRKK